MPSPGDWRSMHRRDRVVLTMMPGARPSSISACPSASFPGGSPARQTHRRVCPGRRMPGAFGMGFAQSRGRRLHRPAGAIAFARVRPAGMVTTDPSSSRTRETAVSRSGHARHAAADRSERERRGDRWRTSMRRTAAPPAARPPAGSIPIRYSRAWRRNPARAAGRAAAADGTSV